MQDVNQKPVVELRGITKEFSGTQVLRGIDLAFHPGEIHGLLGEIGRAHV